MQPMHLWPKCSNCNGRAVFEWCSDVCPRTSCRSAALEIVAAHYSAGCLLLSESAGAAGGGGAGATKLLAASRNTTLPPATINTHTGSGYGYGGYGYGGYGGGSYGYGYGGFVAGGLRESVTELDNFVPGALTAPLPQPVHSVAALQGLACHGSSTCAVL